MRLLQLSDPHLVADPAGFCRGRQPLPRLRHALHVALTQLAREDLLPEQLLLTGDLCQDETWGGYVRLRELLAGPGLSASCPPLPPVALLAGRPWVRGLVFWHVHQYWQGWLPGPPGRPLLGCPSTLCPFGPIQPCPLDRAEDPGGLLLELGAAGEIRHRLLRWNPPEPP